MSPGMCYHETINTCQELSVFIANKLKLNAEKTRAMLKIPKNDIISRPKFCISNTNIQYIHENAECNDERWF